MSWKKHSPEEIVGKVARVRAALDGGVPLGQAIAVAQISAATYFRWRALYGGMSLQQMHELWDRQREHARLRRVQRAESEEAVA